MEGTPGRRDGFGDGRRARGALVEQGESKAVRRQTEIAQQEAPSARQKKLLHGRLRRGGILLDRRNVRLRRGEALRKRRHGRETSVAGFRRSLELERRGRGFRLPMP